MKKKNKVFIVVLILVIIMLIGLAIFFCLDNKKSNIIKTDEPLIIELVKGEKESQTVEFDFVNDSDTDQRFMYYAKDLENTLNENSFYYTEKGSYDRDYPAKIEDISISMTGPIIPANTTKHMVVTFHIDESVQNDNGASIKFELCGDTWDNVLKSMIESGFITKDELEEYNRAKEVCEKLKRNPCEFTKEEFEKYIENGIDPE